MSFQLGSRVCAVLLVGVLTVARFPGAAEAADWGTAGRVLNISALSFVAGTDDAGQVRGSVQHVLQGNTGKFFANVPLESGTVTKFALCARDNDSFDVTARLFAKPFTSTSLLADLTTMATVSTSGASTTITCFSTTSITQPVINPTQFFYFVEIEFTANNNVDVYGVQITH